MAIIDLRSISSEEIRNLVLQAYKNHQEIPNQYLSLCAAVAKLAVTNGYVANPIRPGTFGEPYQLNDFDQDRVREVIWDLVVQRVMTIGLDSSNASWPFIKLTEYGKTIVESEKPTPHDPSGYLKRLHDEIPSIDPVIMIYITESLHTYNINSLLSSTITLGCASEKAFLLLIESFISSMTDAVQKEKATKETLGRPIKRQFDIITSHLSRIRETLPKEISDGMDTVLIGVFDMIRNYRNDAGHPTGKTVSREQAYANLQVFIPYIKKIYQLIAYFSR